MKIKIRILYYSLTSIFLLGCNPDHGSRSIYGQNNAVWGESIYLRGFKPSTGERLTMERVRAYAYTLEKNNIKYCYLFAGPYGEDGHLPDYPFTKSAVATVSLLKKIYPELQILPWIGGIQNKTVFLADSVWIKNAVADTKRLIDILKVPGVHVDLEYILPGEPVLDSMVRKGTSGEADSYPINVNSFHEKLRVALPGAFISSVVVATSKDTRPWKRKTSIPELKELITNIDQLSFLYYDTTLKDQELFESNCYDLIKDIETLKAARNIQYLISIGTFINEPALQKYRDLNIENIPNSLITIREQIAKVNDKKRIIDGISIFCDWETDENEWNQFSDNWTK